MHVITFANPKGGSGKTTSAFLLAEQIALSGGRVSVLDLDPNANILHWAEQRHEEGKSVPFAVHPRPDVDRVIETIDSLESETDYLIIDLEGSRDQIATFALSRTDLCVIPFDGSPMEARQAAQAVRLVHSTAGMLRQDIPHVLLFTRMNAAIQTTDERDVRQEMAANDVPLLPVRIIKRAPYTRVFRDGVLLSELPEIVEAELAGKTASPIEKGRKQIESAIENARAFSQAIVDLLAKVPAA